MTERWRPQADPTDGYHYSGGQQARMATDLKQPILLKVTDAAAMGQISRSQMYALIGAGDIPSIQIGRSRRIRRDDLLTWLDRLASGAERLDYEG